jgi:ParB family chromosome partitioning protein
MAKSFAPRVSKRNRTKLDLSEGLDAKLFKMNDEMLLRGAELQKVTLNDIEVRAQVRTKFNDGSIAELATNIKENGLIQPLVLHREGRKFVLICGERRFRAMSTISDMFEAPCFILEDKTKEELMAIQFSENSSREELHYIDQADSIFNYKKVTQASERKIQSALGISKSEVHRCILIGRLPKPVKEAAKLFNTEKYVLLEWDAIADKKLKEQIKKQIISGDMTKRSQLKKLLKGQSASVRKSVSKQPAVKGLSASMFIKAMNARAKDTELDPEMKKMMKKLIEETKGMVDM